MKETARISDAENEVMEVIWSAGKVTVQQVQQTLSERRHWAYNTVGTFMQRLYDKGLLKREKSGKTNVYEAAVSKAEYKKAVTEDFLRQVHSGSKRSLMSAVFDERLANDEIDKLLDMIEKR